MVLVIALAYAVLVAQKAVNFAENDPDGSANARLTPANYFWLILGAVLWILVFVGIIFHDRLERAQLEDKPVERTVQQHPGLGKQSLDIKPPLDSPLLLLNAPGPIYPPSLSKQGEEGQAKVRFLIAKDGTIANAFVLSSSNPKLDEAALEAIYQWRFSPPLRNGEWVQLWIEQLFVFKDDKEVEKESLP